MYLPAMAELAHVHLDLTVHGDGVLLETVRGLEGLVALGAGVRSYPGVINQMAH